MKKSNIKIKNFVAFTLAEVLITLAIIGVVAALTVPTVIRNYQERQTVAALKKAYAHLSQAFNMATIEKGAISTWSLENCDTVLDIIEPYLKITKKMRKGVWMY
jgi:prepilin-type N-terminal cleavage/methylation domain-containing protein